MAEKADRPTLIHPVYLNTPMLLSFVATLEDGVSLSAAVTETRSKNTTLEASGSGEGGTESVLALLGLKLTATGELARTSEKETSAELTFTRQHTTSSLFGRLVDGLSRAGELKASPTITDVNNGDLVSFEAEIEYNPYDAALDAISAALPILDIMQKAAIAPKQSRGQNNENQRTPKKVDTVGFGKLVDALRADQKDSTIVDLLGTSESFQSIITADRDYFTAVSLNSLLGGKFKVIGKVTSVFATSEDKVPLVRRGNLTRIPNVKEVRSQIVELLGSDDSHQPLPDEIPGPVLQILPLAIYI